MKQTTTAMEDKSTSIFDLQAIAAKFPPSAKPMLLDIRLTDEPAASSRLFRIYRPAPAHSRRQFSHSR